MIEFEEHEQFAKARPGILSEDELFDLQLFLAVNPGAGAVIRDSGGCRKLRWAASGRGKRGGARVIYFHFVSPARILLLRIYPKNAKSDLTPKEIQSLKQTIKP